MKLTVRCRSGLRIDFEGTLDELERFDGFLAELARLERARLAPVGTENPAGSPQVAGFEPVPTPSPPSLPELDAEPADAPRPEDDSPVPAVDPPASPASVPSPLAGERDASSQARVLEFLQDADGEVRSAEIQRATGLTKKAITHALLHLKGIGLAAHNGRKGPGSRWSAAPGNGEPPAFGAAYGESTTVALAAIERLAVCSKRELVDETGIPDSTLTNVLRRLVDDGQVIATGATTARRFRLATDEDLEPDAPADPPAASLHDPASPEPADPPADTAPDITLVREPVQPPLSDLEQRIVELVHRHGPVTPVWVADQLTKNRRETGSMMVELGKRGVLVNDSGWFTLPGDEEAQAA